ncbi:MAG: non-canonical purine NTP pyrophosphatase, RdgB/HAM1 family [Alicyclobacillus sp. RIFOXYA1_FULL_53_8]|nr:MAG: non-canonical purine NTP pyrophosphatase, RdgB/HAM1 family [Alicyclobacillus sp. RIFOXYA1_FULL_53_8]
MDVIYIASKNEHKVAEFRDLLRPLTIPVMKLPQDCPESPESGTSFEENALQKARFYSAFVDGWVLADDSGLCVDALAGAPGIHSARFAGDHCNDKANNEKLLRMLEKVPMERRTGEFVCVIALWNQSLGKQLVVRGTLPGTILPGPRGENGFGYDPLFFLSDYHRSVAELPAAEKNRISHRARAVESLIRVWEADNYANLHRQ